MIDVNKPWPKLDPDQMDDDGAKALASAIIFTTAEDYYDVCDHPMTEVLPDKTDWQKMSIQQLKTRLMIEKFINSERFFILSVIDRERFVNTIKKMKEQGVPFPRDITSIAKMNKARKKLKKKEKTA